MRGSSVATRLYLCLTACAVVVLLLHIDYVVHRTALFIKYTVHPRLHHEAGSRAGDGAFLEAPANSDAAPVPPPPESDVQTLPMDALLKGLVDLARQRPQLATALTSSQAQRLLPMVEKVAAHAESDQQALEATTAVILQQLTTEQRTYVDKTPPLPNQSLVDPHAPAGQMGDPLGQKMVEVLRRRIGNVGTLPSPTPIKSDPMFNGEEQRYLEGVLTLEQTEHHLTPQQALKILPYVEQHLQVNLRQLGQVREMLGVLSKQQQQYMLENSDLEPAPPTQTCRVLLEALRRRAADLPPGPAADKKDTDVSLPMPPHAAGGPNLPWPLSFPKLLPGLFMLDKTPAMRLSPQQAAQLLPLVDRMGHAWNTVHVVEINVKGALDTPQRAWVSQQKHRIEQSNVIGRIMDACGSVAPGENASITVAMRICEQRMPHPLPAALQAAAEKARRRQPQDAEFETRPGEEWLTVFDETTAIYLMEHDKADLRLTPQQAAIIHAILSDVVEPLKVVALNEAELRKYLTTAQTQYVQAHMEALYNIRTGVDKPEGTDGFAFPGDPAATDASKYHDPLYYETDRFLRKVMARTP